MGTARRPLPVKLFLAVMYSDSVWLEKALAVFCGHMGEIDKQFGPLPVSDFTKYYDTEMGTGLLKVFATFKNLISPGQISLIKENTNLIERQLSQGNGARNCNLDPGYIAPDKFVLASTKDYYHRLYLERCIYAEVTLYYHKNSFQSLPWTYPDYKDPGVLGFLESQRLSLVEERRERREES